MRALPAFSCGGAKVRKLDKERNFPYNSFKKQPRIKQKAREQMLYPSHFDIVRIPRLLNDIEIKPQVKQAQTFFEK